MLIVRSMVLWPLTPMRLCYTVPAVMEIELRRHGDWHPANGGKLNSWNTWYDRDSLNNRDP